MPNHCFNIIECIRHDDPDVIKRLEGCLKLDPPVFFAEFVQCPQGEECTFYWGTKWDVYDVMIDDVAENTMKISFNTAWGPPTEAYAKLKGLGFTIDALFMEGGCDFCGYWKDGEKIIYNNVRENLTNIPEEFHFYFCDEDEND